jgi:hypothetical protein
LLKKIRSFRKITLVLSLLLALTVVGVGGAALAGSFTAHTTVLQGTVTESITVTVPAGDGDWANIGGVWTWTVAAEPNESKFITLKVWNSAHAPITVNAGVTGGCTTITGAGAYVIPTAIGTTAGTRELTFTWNVDSDFTPGTCTSNITISR